MERLLRGRSSGQNERWMGRRKCTARSRRRRQRSRDGALVSRNAAAGKTPAARFVCSFLFRPIGGCIPIRREYPPIQPPCRRHPPPLAIELFRRSAAPPPVTPTPPH